MANEIKKIVCLACGGRDYKKFTEKDGFEINKCLSCRSLFIGNLPDDLSQIYSKEYFWGASNGFGYVDYDADKEPMKKVFESCLQKLDELVKEKILLDIGAATGYFVGLAKDCGWQASGVEVGSDAAEFGRKRGLDIKTGTVANLSPDKKFSVVTMFDVIEHVRNPSADLNKVREVLKSDGALLLITPDSGSLYAKLMGKRWHLIVPPEHVVLFNQRSLSNLLERIGFEILEIKSPSKSFTVEYILHTLLRWQKLKIWNWLLRFVKKYPKIASLCIPINLGDNMMIYARLKRRL